MCVCDKSKFHVLESSQDAVGRPAVFCLAAKRYNGLVSQFRLNYLIHIINVSVFHRFCQLLNPFCPQNLLKHCHSAHATYLFQQDKFYDVNLDSGDKSVQCGRKVDCLKLWLMWKAVGSNGLAERVDKAFVHVR